MKVGRNDPCPCGSGRKYKHCCLAAAASMPETPEDLAWRRVRRALEGFPADMLRFVTHAYGPAAIDEAWQEFTLWEGDTFDFDTPHAPVFMPWLFHCWSPDSDETRVAEKSLHEVTPTEAFLHAKGRHLDPALRRYLEACTGSPFSFFEIVRADPARGFRVRDIITGKEQEVLERSASAMLQPGDIVFGQIVATDGIALVEALSPFPIRPDTKAAIIELRRRITASEEASGPEHLREWDLELRELYLEIADRTLNPKLPTLQNTDGEPLSLQRLSFDIDSAREAFDALKHLALDARDDELLDGAKCDTGGTLLKVRFDWSKRGNKAHASWDNTVLGSIEIDGTRLTAEVNSEARAQTFRDIVERALGERARFRATKIRSMEKLLAETKRNKRATKQDAEDQALAELPEVKARLTEMLEAHYERWVNEEIPMLGGRTPLEAVKDRDGREIVEGLVLQIERDGSSMKPPLDAGIVWRLRERLGLMSKP
ncbi:MAG: hypothetical protein A3H35_04160 [Betaproteobacteria bacterium RIFCSPLOWO2_02_FULL_62_17]|nr:MAG: hypothetical protein A3H35_04160 [Betaproteobacteria bacterium RIFCSPLOWO2_02_FULL_62_17]